MRWLQLGLACALAVSLSGCVVGTVVRTAASVTGTVVSTTVGVTGAVVKGTARAVTGGSHDNDSDDEKKSDD
jgi:hypothetical protein